MNAFFPKPCVLIADDLLEVREALRLLLKAEGFDTVTAGSPAEILQAVTSRELDAVLMDLNYSRDTTSGREGLDLLARLRAIDDALPVVVMTAWANVGLAVEAMRQGARDFVEKPWDNARLVSILRNQTDLRRALRRGERLEAENELLRGPADPTLIAESPEMRPVIELIARVGPSEANVLITGENGTGKGVVARALHAVSARAGVPMVTVNTGGLSEAVFESELFGHVRGAFTDAKTDRVGRFELADGGTIFLDEIANISLGQQAKLLRVLETGEFERLGSSKTRTANVRVFSARICCSASTRWRSTSPPCASAGRTSSPSPSASSASTPCATASRSAVSRREPAPPCWPTRGRATCASSITRWSAGSSWGGATG
jgi:DNA-binding NtrC family response regulator